MFSLIALYFAHRRLAVEASAQPVVAKGRASAANEQGYAAILPLAA